MAHWCSWVDCSPMDWETGVQSQSYQRVRKKRVLDVSLLNTQHSNVQIKGKWNNPEKVEAPALTPSYNSYWKRSLQVTLDNSSQLMYIYIYIKINVNSNHLKTIIKQVPKPVKLRIRNLSANKKIFQESSKIYKDALKKGSFRKEFTYQEENIPNDINKENKKYSQKNRKRKIISVNPAFCRLASLNVGKYFFKLIDKHFKHNNILYKIFNRKTLKMSYSCTKNIFEIINNHNKEIIKEFHERMNINNNNNNTSKQNKCNCKTRMNCPMNGLCNLDNVVYQGIIYPPQKKMLKIEKLI